VHRGGDRSRDRRDGRVLLRCVSAGHHVRHILKGDGLARNTTSFSTPVLQTPRSCQTFLFQREEAIWSAGARCTFTVFLVVFQLRHTPQLCGWCSGSTLVGTWSGCRPDTRRGWESGLRALRGPVRGLGGGGGLSNAGPGPQSRELAARVLLGVARAPSDLRGRTGRSVGFFFQRPQAVASNVTMTGGRPVRRVRMLRCSNLSPILGGDDPTPRWRPPGARYLFARGGRVWPARSQAHRRPDVR